MTPTTFVAKTPFGGLAISYVDGKLTRARWVAGSATAPRDAFGKRVARAVTAYFAGNAAALDGIPVAATRTPFQQQVDRALCRVKAGGTVSYGELARRVNKPRAARAVGSCMRSNPLPLFVPCHRVLQSNGKLGNYSGRGGAGLKARLLAFEKTLR